MQKKLFKPISIGAASAFIAVTSFLSYAIGLIRDRVIAVNFGTTSATDTYNASFLIPDMLFNLFIAGALAAAFLPVFSDYLVKNKKEAYRIANTILTGGTIFIGVLSILAFIFMDHIIPVAFPQFTQEMQGSIIYMTRLMLPSAILFTISNTMGNILMSYKHFMAYAISPILYNCGIIGGILIFNNSLGIYSAAAGVLIGAILHASIRLIDSFFTEYKYKPEFAFSHPGFKKILKLMIPRSISLISWQINLYIFAIVGVGLMEGGFAAFNFSRNIQSFAVSLFGIAFATAVFPFLADSISKKDYKKYTEHVRKTMQRILFFTIPAMAGIMVLSKEIIDLILSGGVFDEKSVAITSLLLFFFALSIPFESLNHILSRAFYAFHNTLIPSLTVLFSNILIALSTIFIAPVYGIKWFTLGFSLVLMLEILILLILLSPKLKNFDFKNFSSSLTKTILASGIMVIVLFLTAPLGEMMPVKLSHIARIAIGGGVFFIIAFIIKSPEISSIKYILDRAFKKA